MARPNFDVPSALVIVAAMLIGGSAIAATVKTLHSLSVTEVPANAHAANAHAANICVAKPASD